MRIWTHVEDRLAPYMARVSKGGPPGDFRCRRTTIAELGAGAKKWVMIEDYTFSIYPLNMDANLTRALSHEYALEFEDFTLANGVIVLRKGYSWDGASGPALDTPDFWRGSALHDAGYAALRDLEQDPYRAERFLKLFRRAADKMLYLVLGQDGMPWWRRLMVWRSVRRFAKKAGRPLS